MIITIDGPAGTGKTTIAKQAAHSLGFAYFDSGALYRCAAWYALSQDLNLQDDVDMLWFSEHFHLTILENNRYDVNGEDVTEKIRTEEVTKKSSDIAKLPKIRQYFIPIQRDYAAQNNVVFEGRDMGTVLFPRADVKIFLTASSEVRATRRLKDLQKRFPEKSFDYTKVLEEINIRDKQDSTRKVSPLKCPSNASVVNTSSLTIKDVIQEILKIVQKKKGSFFRKMPWFYRTICWISISFFKIFYRLQVVGKENIPVGAALIAANHASYFDPAVIGGVFPEEIMFMAKKSLFNHKIFGWIIRKLNSLPVERGVADRATFRKVLGGLARGKKVLIFPEGERSFDGKVGQLLPGLGFLAYSAKCPILPVYLSGTHEAWPRGSKKPKLFGKITCTYGKPLYFDFFEKDRKQIIEEVESNTLAALKTMEKKVLENK